MKKILLILSMAGMVSVIVSCTDMKSCYCYEYRGGDIPVEISEYANAGYPCNSLSRGVEGNVGSRVCVETYERMDPGMLASKK
ncbi:MAG: hypothetical protein SPJ13_01690 [Bacteroidales bacterium]|nr:hypothetical protein [Bacteroidales bacterium]